MSTTSETNNRVNNDFTFGQAHLAPRDRAGARNVGNDLDKDAFLRLLLVQLQHQDPLNPMEDREFIAQMAQFSALEQMQNMNNSQARTQAYEMIGREVGGQAFNSETNMNDWIGGVVTAVNFVAGEPVLEVTDMQDPEIRRDLPLTRVEFVGNRVQDSVLQNMNNMLANQQFLAMVGQEIQAITRDANGDPAGYVEGVVTSVRFGAGNQTILMVGNREVHPAEVISVGPDNRIIGGRIHAAVIDRDHPLGFRVIENGEIIDVRMGAGGASSVVVRDTDGSTHTVQVSPISGLARALSVARQSAEMGEPGLFLRGTVGSEDDEDSTQIIQGFFQHVEIRAGRIFFSVRDVDGQIGLLHWDNAREVAAPSVPPPTTPPDDPNGPADPDDPNGD